MNACLSPTQLAQYAERIGLAEWPRTDADGLARLQEAHRRSIGFENLDIRLGRSIRIDSASVFDKLVPQRRGGYCFEQNRLFSDVLSSLGFVNRPLLARVRLGMTMDDPHPPRSHVLLLVEIAGEPWIADAGFGGSYVPPLPLLDGAQVTSPDGTSHRLTRVHESLGTAAGQWLLERAGLPDATDGRTADHQDWQPQYSFDLSEVAQADLDQCNHFTSTLPGGRFTTLHVASVALEAGFASLTDNELVEHRAGTTRRSILDNPAEYRTALAEIFGLSLSAEEVGSLPLFR